MKISRGVKNAQFTQGCVLTIGNFDGVHLGHQALLQRLAELADARQLPSVLMTFEPHPIEVLAPERAPPRLTRFREKMLALKSQPIDHVVCMRFDSSLAAMSAERFIDEVLCGVLRVRHVLVGDDFHFGHRGSGNFSTLQDAARAGRFDVGRLDTVTEHATRISSTRVRELIALGELSEAAALLGRPVSICGRVTYGEQLGRTIGFPTANFPMGRSRCALSGVYAVSLVDGAGRVLDAVANVGTRPTVDGRQSRVEVHVLDFSEDLYGQAFEVQFHQKIRAEQRFDGLQALQTQIALDVEVAREVHARRRRDAR